MSDAFVAFDLDTGKILWSRQMTAADAYTSACRIPDKTNCPDVERPRFRLQLRTDPGDARPTESARWWRDRSPGWCMPSIPIIKAS